MDPYNEQRLRDEVIYLHSLWHQGHPTPSPTVNLHPSNPTRFKKPKKKPPKFNTRKKNLGNFSGKEWSVKPLPADPPLNQSGWPELKLKPKPQPTRLPTPEELERHNWNQIQQRALNSAKEFYSNNSDDDDDDDDDEDDDMSEDDDNVENKEYDFFWKLFNGDEELKAYYVKHCGGGGEFSSLVCGGANEKQGKRFKDWFLGIDQLPSSIVSDHKSSELQGNDVNVHKDVNNLNNVVDDENLNGRTHDVAETVGNLWFVRTFL
ncbi:hypothetical protein L1987_02291 [Smallanthus sonchifolius]|uniref:Uncharacterized protein n=1 Tax=Smallanthus sonchifolius TaxID=185202 RepID=A0ACB9K7D6_9ASTR|nr:hypothetical protein L1987_02291 [Smallanthus sonchifolius]